MKTNKSSVIEIESLELDTQMTDSYSKYTHKPGMQHFISNNLISDNLINNVLIMNKRCAQEVGASNDESYHAVYVSNYDSNDEIDQNVEVTPVSPNYRLPDEDEFIEKWPKLADDQEANLAVRNEYKKASSKPESSKATKGTNLKTSKTKASADRYTSACEGNTSDPYRASEPLPVITESNAKDEKAAQKNIVTFQNDQVLERVFMNVLIKHTGIALAIIIPLAAFSAYAAPVTPTAPVSADLTEVAK